MVSHEITVRVRAGTPLIIASGRPRWGADLATTVDENGYPYIPGTSLRGRARHVTHAVARALGLFACDEPDPSRMCGASELADSLPGVAAVQSADDRCLRRFCAVCRLFGSPQKLPSRVWVTDLRAELGDLRSIPSHMFTRVRNHVAINRRRRVAETGKLFAVEATSAGLQTLTYEGSIRVLLPDEDRALMGLFMAALTQVYAVGGQNSRGYGWVEGPGLALGGGQAKDLCFACNSYSIEQAQDDLRALLALAGGGR